MAVILSVLVNGLTFQAPVVPCVDQNLSEVALGSCLDKEVLAVDQELNRTYQQIMRALPKQQQLLLRTSERAWLQSRDADLALFESFVQGNHPSITVETEQARVIRERIRVLKGYRP
jgi:uncharacterized protein YecT (DUF1311 family)